MAVRRLNWFLRRGTFGRCRICVLGSLVMRLIYVPLMLVNIHFTAKIISFLWLMHFLENLFFLQQSFLL